MPRHPWLSIFRQLIWFALKSAPHLEQGYGGVGDNGSYHWSEMEVDWITFDGAEDNVDCLRRQF